MEQTNLHHPCERIMVNLNHPCREIDVWVVNSVKEVEIALRQGYIPLEQLRALYAECGALREETTTYKEALKLIALGSHRVGDCYIEDAVSDAKVAQAALDASIRGE